MRERSTKGHDICVKVTPGEITVVNLLNDADLTAQAAKKSGIKKKHEIRVGF